MRVARGVRAAPAANWIELGAPIEARLGLADEPTAEVVASYILTRGAEAAWAAINDRLRESRGECFLISGVAGTGKTHFLNYAVGLSNRAATDGLIAGRHLTITVDASQWNDSADPERRLIERLALQLAGDNRAAALWRQAGDEEALTLALDQARRQGVKGILVAIDLGEREPYETETSLGHLAATAREFRQLRLIVLVAGRAMQCAEGHSFDVAAENGEALTVICGRARRLREEALPLVTALYRNLDSGAWEPRQIYPLHRAAAEGLMRLYRSEDGIAAARQSCVRR